MPVLGWPVMADDKWFCAMAKARAGVMPLSEVLRVVPYRLFRQG